MMALGFVYNDGGRAAAGYRGDTRDCVTRAVAIAAEISYQNAYDRLNQAAHDRNAARTGVPKPAIRKVLADLGWAWTPTMGIGTG